MRYWRRLIRSAADRGTRRRQHDSHLEKTSRLSFRLLALRSEADNGPATGPFTGDR